MRKAEGIKLIRRGLARVVAQHGRTVILYRRDNQTVHSFER